jgi:DNA adenine methylase
VSWGQSHDPVERARVFYVLTRQSFGSLVGESWAYGLVSMKSFHNSLSMFDPICRRLEQVQIENRPALDVIDCYDSARTCFFVDPPYLPETRVRLSGYHHEMTADEHSELLRLLKTVRGKVVLCGYPSEVYDDELHGWRSVERNVAVATGTVDQVRPRRIEKVWMNFDDPKLVG